MYCTKLLTHWYDAHSGARIRGMMHVAKLDFTEECTLQSPSLRWDARGRVFGHTVFCFLDTAVGCTVHTAEFLKNFNISVKFKNAKIL